MSLARALDHNYDSRTESSPELAAHVTDHYVDESAESAAAVNVTRQTSTRYILYYYIESIVL